MSYKFEPEQTAEQPEEPTVPSDLAANDERMHPRVGGSWPALVVCAFEQVFVGRCTSIGLGGLAVELPAHVRLGDTVNVTVFFENERAGFAVAEVVRLPDSETRIGGVRLQNISHTLLEVVAADIRGQALRP